MYIDSIDIVVYSSQQPAPVSPNSSNFLKPML